MMGISVPSDWEGMRLWEGPIAEQLDDEGDAINATLKLLEGGDIQYFVDFNNPHNSPVLEWIKRTVEASKTNWTDVRLAGQKEAKALLLLERERSAKIRQEGYAFRIDAATAKSTTELTEERGNR